MSGTTPEMKILQDNLLLFAGLYFALSGLEIAADPKRVRYPPDTLKMTAHFILAVFLIQFYLTVARKNSNNYFGNNFDF